MSNPKNHDSRFYSSSPAENKSPLSCDLEHAYPPGHPAHRPWTWTLAVLKLLYQILGMPGLPIDQRTTLSDVARGSCAHAWFLLTCSPPLIGQGSLLNNRLQCPPTEPYLLASMTAHVEKTIIWSVAEFRPSVRTLAFLFLVSLTILVESPCTCPVSATTWCIYEALLGVHSIYDFRSSEPVGRWTDARRRGEQPLMHFSWQAPSFPRLG